MPTALAFRVKANLTRPHLADLPATLTFDEWTRTVADFSGACAYCGTAPAEVLEHFVPLSWGGGTTPGNCLPACIACDDRKSGKRPDRLGPTFSAERIEQLRAYLAGRSIGDDVSPKTPRAPARNSFDGSSVAFRLPAAQLAALDTIVAAEQKRRNDPGFTRTSALREAVAAYLDARAPGVW